MSSSQRFAFLLLAAGGCTAVYDAQYDDRASELEEFRTEFLPGSDQVRFFTAAPQKLFWQSLEKPLDAPLLHSIDTSTQARIDYEFSRGDNNIDSRTQMSNTLIVKCSFGTTTAFDATVSNRMIDMTTMGSDDCAVDGSTVYFAVARTIRRWTPGAGPPAQVVDLAAAGVGTASIAGVQ